MIRFVLLTLLLSVASQACHAAVTFDWAHVGNAGNAAAPRSRYGDVAYDYAIATTEVTNAQYVEFLNAVAGTDDFGGIDPALYHFEMGSSTHGGIIRSGSSGGYTYAVKPDAVGQGPDGSDYTYANKPVVYTSFIDAMRFVNWLHNGQGSAGTETGVYTIGNGLDESRSANATFWIPSADEWYKAASHDASAGKAGVYFTYANGSDITPDNNLPVNDSGNSANSLVGDDGYTTGNPEYPMTDVGSYSLSISPYGTFDQTGNVLEWTEELDSGLGLRGVRGGAWRGRSSSLPTNRVGYSLPDLGGNIVGFRIATIPEPTTATLLILAAIGSANRRLPPG